MEKITFDVFLTRLHKISKALMKPIKSDEVIDAYKRRYVNEQFPAEYEKKLKG